MTWRTVSLLLAALLLIQTWRACTRRTHCPTAPADETAERSHTASSSGGGFASDGPDRAAASTPSQSGDGFNVYGFKIKVPRWAFAMLPQKGEGLRAYRDRMLPLARAAIAPHRARVARSREDLAQQLGLDERQRTTLDTATRETAQAIQDKLFAAALSGDFMPKSFKPMTAVGTARELLDLVDNANQRFVDTLSQDQRDRLARHPFDFGDYLLFSTPWEDAITGL